MEDYKGMIKEKALGSGHGVRSYRQLHDVDVAYHHHHAVGGGLDHKVAQTSTMVIFQSDGKARRHREADKYTSSLQQRLNLRPNTKLYIVTLEQS